MLLKMRSLRQNLRVNPMSPRRIRQIVAGLADKTEEFVKGKMDLVL